MQTFLPMPISEKPWSFLDNKRLGKQRVEASQILSSIMGHTYGWRNHPATRMWEHHPAALCDYAIECCREWVKRGFRDNLLLELQVHRSSLDSSGMPGWMGIPIIHQSHIDSLVIKDPIFYGLMFGATKFGTYGYVWPLWTGNEWKLTFQTGKHKVDMGYANRPLTA